MLTRSGGGSSRRQPAAYSTAGGMVYLHPPKKPLCLESIECRDESRAARVPADGGSFSDPGIQFLSRCDVRQSRQAREHRTVSKSQRRNKGFSSLSPSVERPSRLPPQLCTAGEDRGFRLRVLLERERATQRGDRGRGTDSQRRDRSTGAARRRAWRRSPWCCAPWQKRPQGEGEVAAGALRTIGP